LLNRKACILFKYIVNVKDLLAPYLGARLRALRGRLRPSRMLGLAPPYKLLGLTALSLLIDSSLSYTRLLPYLTLYYIVLFHRLSYNSCSACLLPTIHPGNTLYIRTNKEGKGCKPEELIRRCQA